MQINLALFWFCNFVKPTIQQPRRCRPTTGQNSTYATNLCEYILHIRTVTVFMSDLISSWVWPLTSLCLSHFIHSNVLSAPVYNTSFDWDHFSYTEGDEMILTHTEGSSKQEDNTPYHLHTRHRGDFSQAKSVMVSLGLRRLIDTDRVSNWTIRSSSE